MRNSRDPNSVNHDRPDDAAGLFAAVRERPSVDDDAFAVETVIDRFEDAWQWGQQPAPEDFLPGDVAASPQLLLELLLVDFERRLEAGLPASTADYRRRLPVLNELPEIIAALADAEAMLNSEREYPPAQALPSENAAGATTDAPRAAVTLSIDTLGAMNQSALGQRSTNRPIEPAIAPNARPADAPHIPGYEIHREIGRGGMGTAYEARDLRLARQVAIKVVDLHTRGNRELAQRLLGEAQAVARLQHANIVQVHEVGESDGRPFLVLELLTGGDLQARLKAGPLPPRDAAELLRTLSRAMHRVHQLRLVHRDLKPANILFAADGTPKISDFGLAKRADDDASLTRTGEIVGTPSHMAPEQALGQSREVTSAADIYSLGSVLFECVAGRPPFRAASVHETLEQLRHEPAPPLGRLVPGVPRELATICAKCLEKSPDRRYASAEMLADDLQRYLDGRPILARPIGPIENLTRWARRQPVVATLTLLSAALLTAVAVVSTVASLRLARANRETQRLALVSQAANEKLSAQVYTLHCRRALEATDGAESAVRLLLDLKSQGLPASYANRFEPRYLAGRFEHDAFPAILLPPKVDVVRFLPGQQQVLAADQLGRLHFIDALSRRVLRSIVAHEKCLNDIVFSPNGRWACTASCDLTAKLWELTTWQPIAAPLVHPWKVSACAFSPDGRWLATATDDEAPETRGKHPIEVRLWDTADWQCRHVLKAQPHGIVRLFFREGGRQLVAVNAQHEIERLDLSGDEPKWLETLPGLRPINNEHHVHRAALSPDGRWLAEQTNAPQGVELWDLAAGRGRLLKNGLGVSSHAMRFLDDRRLLFVSPAGRLGIWNVDLDYLEADFGKTAPILDLDLSQDGTYFAAGGEQGRFYVGKLPSVDQAAVQTVALPGVRFPALIDCVSPDLTLVAAMESADQGLHSRMFELPSGAPVPLGELAAEFNRGAVFSPNRRLALFQRPLPSRRMEQALVALDEPTPRLIARILNESIALACFSPDSSRVFGVADGRGQLFDSASGQVVQEFALPGSSYGACFTPDGAAVLVGQGDQALRLELATGQRRPCGVATFQFSVAGVRLLSPGAGVFDLATGRPISTFEQPLGGNNSAGDISPDGQTVAMTNRSLLAGLWDAATGSYLGPLVEDPVGTHWSGCRFSADGRQLVVWGHREGERKLGLVMFFRALSSGSQPQPAAARISAGQ